MKILFSETAECAERILIFWKLFTVFMQNNRRVGRKFKSNNSLIIQKKFWFVKRKECPSGGFGGVTTPETRKFFQQKKLPFSTRTFLSLSTSDSARFCL